MHHHARLIALTATLAAALATGCAESHPINDTEQDGDDPSRDFPEGVYAPDDPRAVLPMRLRDVPDMPTRPRQRDPSKSKRSVAPGGNLVTGESFTIPLRDPASVDLSRWSSSSKGAYAAWLDQAASKAATEDGIGVSQQALVTAPDTRERVHNTLGWPQRTTVQLFSKFEDGTLRGCSGTLIEKDVVLTAAHCILDPDGHGLLTAVEAVPGLDSTYMPFGLAEGVYYYMHPTFANEQDYDHDVGVIMLDRNIGTAAGYTGMRIVDLDEDVEESAWPARIWGYPGDKPRGQMWYSEGDITDSGGFNLVVDYTNDLHSGNSGSGVRGLDGLDDHKPFAVDSGDWDYIFGVTSRGVLLSLLNVAPLTVAIEQWPNPGPSDHSEWTLLGTGAFPVMGEIAMLNGVLSDDYDAFWVKKTNAASNPVWVRSQRTGNGPGSYESGYSIGGSVIGDVAAISRVRGEIQLFATGSDNKVWTKAYLGSPNDTSALQTKWAPSLLGWWPMGGPSSVETPTAISQNANNLELFIRRSDNGVSHITWDGVWSAWESLGGRSEGKVAAISLWPGTIDVFAEGEDGSIRTKWKDANGWHPSQTGWESLGKPPDCNLVTQAGKPYDHMGQPVVASLDPDRVDVFSICLRTHRAYVKSWINGSGWGNWESMSNNAEFVGPLTVVPDPTKQFYEIFVVGTNRRAYAARWNKNTSPLVSWKNQGGSLTAVSGVTKGKGWNELLGRDTDGYLRGRSMQGWIDGPVR